MSYYYWFIHNIIVLKNYRYYTQSNHSIKNEKKNKNIGMFSLNWHGYEHLLKILTQANLIAAMFYVSLKDKENGYYCAWTSIVYLSAAKTEVPIRACTWQQHRSQTRKHRTKTVSWENLSRLLFEKNWIPFILL